ncbi:hypothetical protein MFUL124B02_10615 [Myxococcus fulvus 124B02]|nr:hypothetical protein MFUL124B02_10615 [Myxococcus fulvus 124B02]
MKTCARGLVSGLAVLLSACGAGEDASARDEVLAESSQAISYGGHDYIFVTSWLTWDLAQAHCRAAGYELVTIDNAAEEAFLQSHQSTLTVPNWWIGLNDQAQEGRFVWSGVPSTSGYSNFYPGEPNNDGGAEDCVVDRYLSPDGTVSTESWNDRPCSSRHPFVCEKGQEATTSNGSFLYSATNTNSGQQNTVNHSVTLTSGMIFTVATCGVLGASAQGDTLLRLIDPYGVEVAGNDDFGGVCGTASSISLRLLSSGSYTIVAGCYGSTSCGGVVSFRY